MPDPIITNVDVGSVEWQNVKINDDIYTAAGAETLLEGTILARDSVSGKLVPFVDGGVTNENGIPKAVITYELVSTGAGDSAVRVAVSGEVRQERLVIHGGGTITKLILDQLRDFSIVSQNVTELNQLDNQ